MSKPLFSDFPEINSKKWKQLIQFDLKGADYNESLIWKTSEGIDVKPFYHADEFKNSTLIPNTKATQWIICQSIFVANVQKSNQIAIDALKRGAESIKFILPSTDISIEDLFKGIDLTSITVYFELQFQDSEFVKQLIECHLERSRKVSFDNDLFINTDIIGNLARTGNWFKNLNDDHKHFETIVKDTNSFSIDMCLYQNAGATMVQQLAYGLAHANEYLNHFDNLIPFEKKQELKVTFNVSVGTNYFFEIAKLRALRVLWPSLATEYHCNTECNIFATPTKRNKTLYDYNTNMLRTTTECMSAVLGGANTICNLVYDSIYHKTNEFGERISRNQLLILKHESYFDKVDNPSEGSYYIEALTEQLAEKALQLFKDIESNGGFLKQLKEGIIQRKIKESATKEQEQFNTKEIILLGTNTYSNPNDKMKQDLELYPFVKKSPRKTLIEPIIEHRLAEQLEQDRLRDE
jgi:methylmalonyl-CoA mutase